MPAVPALNARFPAPLPPRTLRAMNEGAPASDEQLMLDWVAGDMAAFEELYGRHRTRLYRFLMRHLRDAALADECFQDIWQKAVSYTHLTLPTNREV